MMYIDRIYINTMSINMMYINMRYVNMMYINMMSNTNIDTNIVILSIYCPPKKVVVTHLKNQPFYINSIIQKKVGGVEVTLLK